MTTTAPATGRATGSDIGHRAQPRPRRPRVRTVVTCVLTLLLVVTVVVPTGALVWESVVDDDTGRFTGEAYAAVYTDPHVWDAIANTAVVIGVVELVAVTLGTLLAWLMTSTDLPLKRWLHFVPMGPLLFPPLLSALGWIFLLTPNVGFVNVAIRSMTGDDSGEGPLSVFSLFGVAWIVGIYSVPYVYAVVAPAFANLDRSHDEAAKMSGARPTARFFTVTLRLLTPSIVGGALFAFIVAASEFTIPLLIGTRANLDFVSTEIYKSVTAFPVHFDEGAAEQCLKPVDDLEGPYPPGDLEAIKQDRRANAGRKGTTRADRSSWSCRCR